MTSPLLVEDQPISRSSASVPPADRLDSQPDRVQKVEEELFALRDTVSRFAELMLVEMKRIKPADTVQTQAPVTVSLGGLAPVPIALPTPNAQQLARGWVLPELISDLWTTLKMYVDPRYRLRRTTQLFIPVIVVLFVLNYWIIGSLPLLGWILVKIGDILLAVLLYKILYREMVRYREVIAQFNAAGLTPYGESKVVHSAEDAAVSKMDIET
jgi:hypothetical protein